MDFDLQFHQFHNGLRILSSIDEAELRAAVPDLNHAAWFDFRRDPYGWFIRAPDHVAERLWALIVERQPGHVIVAPAGNPSAGFDKHFAAARRRQDDALG